MKSSTRPVPHLRVAALALLAAQCAQADLYGPYRADANTLHLWNLDETATGDFDHDGTLNRTEFLLNLAPDSGSSFFSAGC